MTDLAGKNIIVTGGSRGIGAGIVRMLDQHGANVAFSYSSRKESAESVLSCLKGDGHLVFQLSVNDEDSVKSGFSEVLSKWDTIDGLVNNAGITKDQLLMRMKPEDFSAVLNTNLTGTFLCTKSVLKKMVKARKGSIVHMTSVVGQMGNAGQANYCASKAGIESFSKSVARELGSRQVRSNCVAPGYIETEMTEDLNDEQKGKLTAHLALPRLGSVQDIASAVCYLLSDQSGYITGQTIAVNGGLYM